MSLRFAFAAAGLFLATAVHADNAAATAGRAGAATKCGRARAVVGCHHAVGRAGYAVQIDRCADGRFFAKLSGPGPTDNMILLDTIDVQQQKQHSKTPGPTIWNNGAKEFELSVNFHARPVPAGFTGSMHRGRGMQQDMVCQRLR